MEREQVEQRMQAGFKLMNRYLMVPMWQMGLGKLINGWPDVMGRIMVITHTGRKSGRTYRTPVNYVPVDGEIYCAAGFGSKSDWYRNIIANPHVEVWLPDGWWAGRAEDVDDHPERTAIMREVLIASGFAAPLLEDIHARKMTDEEIDDLTAGYRLLHIRREEACSGPGGPGEYAWVWPLATFTLALMLLMRPRRRR